MGTLERSFALLCMTRGARAGQAADGQTGRAGDRGSPPYVIYKNRTTEYCTSTNDPGSARIASTFLDVVSLPALAERYADGV